MADHDLGHLDRQKRSSRGLVLTGIIIAAINMGLAWTVMFIRPSTPEKVASVDAATGGNDLMQSARLLNETMRFAVTAMNEGPEQQVLILGVAFAFALLAIGFSLFVMGTESALSIRGEVPDLGRLIIKTASPGLLCILLSAIVLCGVVFLTRVVFGDPEHAAKAEMVRAEGLAKAELIRAEAQAKGQQAMNDQTERFRREMQAERERWERRMDEQGLRTRRGDVVIQPSAEKQTDGK